MNIKIESENIARMLVINSRRVGRTPDEEAEMILRTAFLLWNSGLITASEQLVTNTEDEEKRFVEFPKRHEPANTEEE